MIDLDETGKGTDARDRIAWQAGPNHHGTKSERPRGLDRNPRCLRVDESQSWENDAPQHLHRRLMVPAAEGRRLAVVALNPKLHEERVHGSDR